MDNCKLGDACECHTPKQRPLCKNWQPSRRSKYYYCARFTASRVTCDLPLTACATCAFYEGAGAEGDIGRPNMTGIDWEDPEERAAYMRDYMRRKRKEGKDG